MGKAKKVLLILGIIAFVVIVVAAAGFYGILSKKIPVAREVRGMDGADKKLAVIMDGSEFKTELKNKLLESAGDGLGVEVFGLKDAKEADPEEYDLVVVVAPVYIGKLQLNAKNYVKKHGGEGSIFLIVTSEGDNGIDLGVDTVSMATSSEFTETPDVPVLSADEISAMIIEKLK